MENNQRTTEEIDIFQLFNLIGKTFQKLGTLGLRFYNFLFRRKIILISLIIIGVVAGYFLNKKIPKKQKTEAIVTVAYNGTAYLYESIEAINFKLISNKSTFLEKLGIDQKNGGDLLLSISPIRSVHEISPEEEVFYEQLESNVFLSDAEKAAVIDKSYDYHKITLIHEKGMPSQSILKKIVTYLRENTHFQKVYQAQEKSLKAQVESNQFVLAQIDSLLKKYASLSDGQEQPVQNLVYSEKTMNIGDLLVARTDVQKETRTLIMRRIENTQFLKILNLGSPKALSKKQQSTLNNYILDIPLLLIGLFFAFSIFQKIHQKARSLKH